MKRLLIICSLLSFAFVCTGCGNSSPSGPSKAPPPKVDQNTKEPLGKKKGNTDPSID